MREGGEAVALALGSNLDDRLGRLAAAVDALDAVIELLAVSSVYESDPVGPVADQPPFLNAALTARTTLGPLELLDVALDLETRAGRRRSLAGGPRTLDVDLILFGRATLARSTLRIPHPRWRDRSFVLAPLAEIAPSWVDPESGRTVLDLWNERRESLPPVRVFAPSSTLRERDP